ncbi:MAG TPA: DUF6152 family protein [Vicinamibacterales bacterium]|nr:DUF6152 family protein [Vicinamibacterales bacterium]
MRRIIVAGAAGLALLLGTISVFAQHTPGAKFDLKKPLTLTGTVTQIDWANPYVHILMKVPGQGQALPALWAVEVENPLLLEDAGWNQDMLPLGETIRVEGYAARNGSKQISGNKVTMTSSNKPIFVGTNGTPKPRPVATGPTPRWPSGQPRLGPPPGETGYWGYPTKFGLSEDGQNIAMDEYGLLKNIADAPKVAPMQPWALALYKERQADSLSHDPMYQACKPPGGPRQFEQRVSGLQFVEQPDFKRVFVMLGMGNRNRRIVYTDGRKQVGQLGGDDDNPLFYGQAVAHWEKDTWVVDTRSFNDEFWFDNGGLPHTDLLHLVERFTRPDMGTLHYEVTVDDPGAYTRSWKSSWNLKWVPGEETPYFLCQDDRP